MQSNSWFNLLLTPRRRYSTGIDQVRARVTLAFALFMIGSSVIIGLVTLPYVSATGLANSITVGAFTIGVLPPIIIIILTHMGYLRPAVILMYIGLLGAAVAGLNDGVATNLMLMLAIPMLYAALVWERRGAVFTLCVELVLILIVAMLQAKGAIAAGRPISPNELSIRTLISVALILSVAFISIITAGELRRALAHVARLVAQLRATSEVAQRTATLINPTELLQQTVNYIRDRFGFYHVQIFLNDADQRFTNLVASTGDVGESLVERGYRLAVGSQGIIGQVALIGEPITLSSDRPDSDAAPSRGPERLPETRSEAALPLIARDRMLGVINIQSTRANAFGQDDIESLSIMASHISIAISNAQIFQEQRTSLNENRRMFLEAEANLREIQLLNQRLTGEAWGEYLKARKSDVIGYTLANDQLRTDPSWTSVLHEAVVSRQPVITTDGDRQIVAVPVELRGRAIGAIEVETRGSVRQSDAIEMLQSVAQRLALSIDNARLFEQAQELAQQELEVNAISSKLQGVTGMNDLIKIAISELSRTLGAEQASIRLGVDLQKELEPSNDNQKETTL
jgi:GAF domain-containing protein